jgi:hypothetical protein
MKVDSQRGYYITIRRKILYEGPRQFRNMNSVEDGTDMNA